MKFIGRKVGTPKPRAGFRHRKSTSSVVTIRSVVREIVGTMYNRDKGKFSISRSTYRINYNNEKRPVDW